MSSILHDTISWDSIGSLSVCFRSCFDPQRAQIGPSIAPGALRKGGELFKRQTSFRYSELDATFASYDMLFRHLEGHRMS